MSRYTIYILLLANISLGQKYFDDVLPSRNSLQSLYDTNDFSEGSRSNWDPVDEWGTNVEHSPILSISRNDTSIFDYGNELLVYDFTTPSSPQYITSIPLEGWTSWGDLVLRDNYLYVCNGSAGLEIIDITNILNPVQIAHYSFENRPGRAYNVAFLGDTLFLGARHAGLKVFDISDLPNLTQVDSFYLDDNNDNYPDCYIDDVEVVNGKAVIGDRCGNIMVLDFSGDAVSVVSQTNTGQWNWRMKVEGNTLLSSHWYYGFSSVDLSNLSSISVQDSLEFSAYLFDFDMEDGNAFLPTNNGLKIINFSDPSNLTMDDYENNLLSDQDIYIEDSKAWVSGYGGTVVLDISDPALISELGSIDLHDGGAWDIKISDSNHLYALDAFHASIRVFDLNNFTSFQEISSISLDGNSNETWGAYEYNDIMEINGDYLYYSHSDNNDSGSVNIYDISNPNNPTFHSTYRTAISEIHDVIFYQNNLILYGKIWGDDGWQVSYSSGFEIVDFSNINNPSQQSLTQYAHDNSPYSSSMNMTIDSDTIITLFNDTVDSTMILNFYSLVDLENPLLVQNVELANYNTYQNDIALFENKLYISSHDYGIGVIDISDIENCFLDTIYNEEYTTSLHIDTVGSNFLYHINYSLNASLLDLELLTIKESDNFNNSGYSGADIESNGEYIVVSIDRAGLHIYNQVLGIAPILSDFDNEIIDEDSMVMFPVVDVTETSVSVITTSNPPHVNGYFDENEMMLSLVPDDDWFGEAEIFIQAYNEAYPDTASTSLILSVLPVNDAPFIDSLLTPTMVDTFSTHPDSQNDILFSWNGGDVDDSVSFQLTIGLEFFGTIYTDIYDDITDTELTISADNLDPLLSGLNLDEVVMSWNVEVSDDEYTALSDDGHLFLTRAPIYADNLELPNILSINDVPDDQGGWVYLEFEPSIYDNDNSLGSYTFERLDDQDWVSLHSIDAYGLDSYMTEVRTLRDSVSTDDGNTSFRVVGSFSSGSFVSEPYDGYSMDNIAPEQPIGLISSISMGIIHLQWQNSEDEDFSHYRIFRDINESFDPSSDNLIGENETAEFYDSLSALGTYFYMVTAVDVHENESSPSEPINVELLSLEELLGPPELFSLHQNYPNPFNPITTLRYDIPEHSHVNIIIYDMIGREVKTLVNQFQDAGYKSVVWDATNDFGQPVSGGIYIYQIQAGSYISANKMVLLK